MRKCFRFAVVALLCMAPVVTLADTIPGFGGSASFIFISEGVVNTGFGLGSSGDVVICENGASCVYSLSNTSGWSDVLVFYDSAHGPFSSAVYGGADKAVMFSVDETGFYSLANFLSNTEGLSSNGLVGATEAANGDWSYVTDNGTFFGNSALAVPEPSSLPLLVTVVAGLVLTRRTLARRLWTRLQ